MIDGALSLLVMISYFHCLSTCLFQNKKINLCIKTVTLYLFMLYGVATNTLYMLAWFSLRFDSPCWFNFILAP